MSTLWLRLVVIIHSLQEDQREKMLFKLLCLLQLCFIVSCSERGREIQKCGEDKFYCTFTEKCLDRKLRCTASNVCVDSVGNEGETKGFEASSGRYYYYRKQSPISSSSSSKRKRWVDVTEPRHWILEYRGFVYEFGTYGAQELDVNDPNYKYGPAGSEKVVKEERVGSSSCTRDDVLRFRDEFLEANPKYGFWKNNCQDFVRLLIKRLRNDCSPRQGRSLDLEKESLKSNCSDHNPNSSSSMLALNWKPFASFAGLILFTIFCL